MLFFSWRLQILFSLTVTFVAKKKGIVFHLIFSNIAIANTEAFKHDVAHCKIS